MKKVLWIAGLCAIVAVLMLWLSGAFTPKVGAGAGGPQAGIPVGGAVLRPVEVVSRPVTESAVGSIRPVLEAAVGSKLMEKVLEVSVKAGQPVLKDEVLVKLDDTMAKAQLQRAQAAQIAAQARFDKARIDLESYRQAFARNVATRTELDQAETSVKTTEAELTQARRSVDEANTVLGYTVIRSPMTGIVIDKKVNAGDTVTPGQVLLMLYDPARMQLIASVRESLSQRLKVGQEIAVRIDALSLDCPGTVSEIVPEAQSASRTFSVKVTGKCEPGVYTGMFGRLLIPLDQEQVMLIPRAAVLQVGQLQMVLAAGDHDAAGKPRRLYRRAVQLGRTFGDRVEVLSGLSPADRVAVPAEGAAP